MADEATTTETKQELQTEQQPAAENVRETPAFRAVVKQLEEARAESARLKAEREKAADAAEKAKLEETQQWGELKRKYEADLALTKAKLNAAELKTALAIKGVTHPAALTLAQTEYRGDEGTTIDEFVEAFIARDEMSIFLPEQSPRTGLKAGDTAAGAPRSGTHNWGQIKVDLQSRDLGKVKAADEAVRAYFMEHGAMPPGFG